MADLTNSEKRAFERLLGMGGGYVLDFSNRTVSDFIMDSTGQEIYDSRYEYGSGSKANRLRGFWSQAPSHTVAKLMGDLLDCGGERSQPGGRSPARRVPPHRGPSPPERARPRHRRARAGDGRSGL
jgi:hypothetical protein